MECFLAAARVAATGWILQVITWMPSLLLSVEGPRFYTSTSTAFCGGLKSMLFPGVSARTISCKAVALVPAKTFLQAFLQGSESSCMLEA